MAAAVFAAVTFASHAAAGDAQAARAAPAGVRADSPTGGPDGVTAAAEQDAQGDVAPGAGLPLPSGAEERRAQRLEGRLKCPVCRTQSVRESTSFMALEMRSKIRELVHAGRSDGEILAFFVDRYGDYILLEPRKQGFGIAAYLLPFLAVLAVAVLLFLRAGRKRGAPPGSLLAGRVPLPEGAAAADATALQRVEQELKRYTV